MRHARDRGFTLMEILVALFVMAIGLSTIMAVFPAGIKRGNETVKDTYSGILAESVMDALKVALRENRFLDPEGQGTYIVFDHDGVTDDPSTHNTKKPDWDKDYILLLPEYFSRTETKIFVYPETSTNKNGGGSAAKAEDDGERVVEDRHGNMDPQIEMTYQVGQFLLKRAQDPEVSEYEKREIISKDPYMQYSFAIKISRARTDSDRNGRIDVNDAYSNFLYQVTVNIYRNFNAEPKSKWYIPIHRMTTQMEI